MRRILTLATVASLVAGALVVAGFTAAPPVLADPLTDYRAEVMADEPYAYLPLDDGSGTTATDVSGNSRDGTYAGSPELTEEGPFGAASTAMLIDGHDQYVDMNAALVPATGDWTVEAWVRPDGAGFGGGSPVWSQYHDNFGTRTSAMVATASVPYSVGIQVGDDQVWAEEYMVLGVYTHVAWRRDGNTLSVIVNGELVDSVTTSQSVDTKETWIGGHAGAWSTAYMNGAIAEFAVYREAISVARLQDHFEAVPPPEEPVSPTPEAYSDRVLADEPHVYLPLDEEDGSIAVDRSGGHRDATYSGVTLGAQGPFGPSSRAASFEALGDRVDGGQRYVPTTGDWTVEAWISVAGPGHGDGAVVWSQYFDDQATRTTAQVDEVSGGLESQVGSAQSTPGGEIQGDDWTYVVWRRSGNRITAFIDGAVVSDLTISGPIDTADTWIGSHSMSGWSQGTFNGRIAQFAVYHRALAVDDLAEHWRAASRPFIGPAGSTAWHGDPVDAATGNFRHDETDLAAPAGAGPATLTRTYTALGGASGVFGEGWMSTVDTRLDVAPGAVLLVATSGQRILFEPDGSSGWKPDQPYRVTLEEGVGEWTVTTPDGTVQRFDGDGRLISLEPPGSPAVTITWAGEVPLTMTSAAGYEITFADDVAYDALGDPMAGSDGLVDSVVSSDGRQVDVTYDATGDTPILATASRPHAVGQTSGTYGVRTYESDGTLITRIVDAVDGSRTRTVVENTYDPVGRVVTQITDTGDELTFAYDQKPAPLAGPLEPATGFTTVTNAASGDVTVYEYDAEGQVRGITDAFGNDVSRDWDGDRPAASESRSGVITEHTYDDAGRVTSVVETAPAESPRTVETLTYVVADSAPTAPTDDRVATRTDELGVTTTYTYDGTARQPETVSVPCDPASTDAATPCPVSGLSTTTYTYFSGPLEGLVETQTDPGGVVTEYTYAADRTVATSTTYDGVTPRVTTYETLRVGDVGWAETNPAAVESRTTETPGGAVTVEVFDAEGRVIESRDPLYDGVTHLATVTTYRLDGEVATVTDPAGNVTTYEVDRAGDPGWAEEAEISEVRTVTGPDGMSTISKSDLSGDVVVEQRGDPAVPAELATTTSTYGPLGRLESVTDPTGVETRYSYDVEGRVTAVLDEDDEATETTYDADGRVEVETDPLGFETTYTYAANGLLEAVEDRTGESTTYTYDALGRPLTTTDARGGVTERTYTPGGRLASETDATARTTTYTYDTAGRLAVTTSPADEDTTFTYDEDGRVVTETSPEGRVTTTTYDAVGRVLTIDDPASGLTTNTFDARGDLITRTDATGGVVTYGYDEVGRVTSVIDPLLGETTYAYDTRGNRVLRVDALDGEQEWHYDLADRVTEEVDPLNRETTYAYDDLGRLDVRTDGAGRTETYGYDAAGQVTSLTYASGTPTSFQYDEEGRRTQMVDATGTTAWTYDEAGNLTGADNPGDHDLAWAWDLAGRRTEITYPNGARYRNLYDPDGLLAEVERDDSGTWVDIAVNTYDDDGNLVDQAQIGGHTRTWTLDATTGLPSAYAEASGGPPTTTGLTYDAAGRIETEAVGGVTTTYDYDAAGQLVTVDRSTGADETYAYDELGRRTTSVVGPDTTTYLWDAASQLTQRTVAGVVHGYQYDGSGRRTEESWNSGADLVEWVWGVRGELTTQRSTTSSTVTEITRATRGDGRLANLTTEVGGVPTDTTNLVWDDTLPVAQVVWSGERSQPSETTAVYGPDLVRVDCATGTDCTGRIAHDAHGSALETPATQAVTQSPSYDAWGRGGPFAVGANRGYRSELTTGTVVHLRARDYDPATGTFLSPDPLDGVDGTTTVANPYHYADNDPLNKTDPTGLRPDDPAFEDPCSHLAAPSGRPGVYTDIGLVTRGDDCGYVWWDGIDPPGPVGGAEVALCLSAGGIGSAVCARAAVLSRKANRYANDYWQRTVGNRGGSLDGPPDGSTGNAFKHIYWNAAMAQEFGKGIARKIANAHEVSLNYDRAIADGMFRQMDFANNWYGRRLGASIGAGSFQDDVGLFVERGRACSRRARDGINQPHTGPFVDQSRCGLK